jgi:hypothetical protein
MENKDTTVPIKTDLTVRFGKMASIVHYVGGRLPDKLTWQNGLDAPQSQGVASGGRHRQARVGP